MRLQRVGQAQESEQRGCNTALDVAEEREGVPGDTAKLSPESVPGLAGTGRVLCELAFKSPQSTLAANRTAHSKSNRAEFPLWPWNGILG